tara:strand:- start:1041 stop:2237 length:1197 start_codon:yes stop_codon:yes gene_type:complete
MGFGTNTEEQKKKLERQFNQPVLLVDQRRAKKNDPRKNLLTIKQAMTKYYPQLERWVKNQRLKGKIKMDGALDDIEEGTSYIMRNLDKIYINKDAQRLLGLKKSWIRDTLNKSGGFLHKKCNLSLFYYEEFDVYAVSDGMHRLILAWICGVAEVQTVIAGTHKKGTSAQDCIDKEYQWFISRNFENNQLTAADKQLMEKKADKLSKDQEIAEKLFKELEINCGSIGADDTYDEFQNPVPPDFNYPDESIDNLVEAFNDTKSVFYVGESAWRLYSDTALAVWTKRYTQKDIALVKVFTILSENYRKLFREYLSSEEFENIKVEYWTTKCVHGEAIVTAIVRLLCRFNGWIRSNNKGSGLTLNDVEKLTNHKKFMKINELKHTILSCIGNSVQLEFEFDF